MSSRQLAALAAACALAASGLSLATGHAGGYSGGQPGGSPDIYSDAGVIGSGAGDNGSNDPGGGASHGTGTGGTIPANDHPHAYGNNGAPHETGAVAYHHGGSAPNDAGYHATTDTSDAGSDSILAHGSGVSHQALLAGGNEVSRDGKADAGDADGNGAASISIDPEAGKLCFAIVVNNLDTPVAAHIHQGRAGKNGPVVVTLKAPDRGDPGTSSGCVDNVDRLLLQAIHAHPWAYYVNVHSGAWPDGAVRGQLY